MDREQYLQINRPSNQCVLCGVSLVEEGRHASVIQESEKDEPPRRDFCSHCWENIGDQKYFSFWLVKRTRPEVNRRLAKAERNEILWRLFNALAGSKDSHTEMQTFLLAHLLMKYGILKWRANRTDREGNRLIVFEHPQTNNEFEVRDRSIGDDALIETLQEIETLIAREANPDLADAMKL